MKLFTVTFETVTPTFMAGENQQEFELRPPSLKGLLRFWWRAYHWGQSVLKPEDLKKKPEEQKKILEERMRKKEGILWGTSDEGGRKSHTSLRLIPPKTEETFDPFPKRKTKAAGKSQPVNILEYLAYGTQVFQPGAGNQFIRPYLPAQSIFSLILSVDELSEHDRKEYDFAQDETVELHVMKSLYLLSLCGAIGAKSHNGFGSLYLKRVMERRNDGQEISYLLPFEQPTFEQAVFFHDKIVNSLLPRFTAFSKGDNATQGMRLFKLKQSHKRWDECLWELGDVYKACKGKLDEPLRCEKRQYLASPIKIQQRIGGGWQTHDFSFLERRAKPYFLRVIRTVSGEFNGYILYLPSEFCPELERDHNKQYLNEKKHQEMNATFRTVCQTFNNDLLADSRMQPIPLWTLNHTA